MKRWQFSFALLLMSCVIVAGLQAQDTGSITGTVRDNTGAVIPGAEVTVTSTTQPVPHKTTSNASGEYLMAGLPAGAYDVSITAKGFKRFAVNGVVLRIAEKARADATLEVGEVTTAIEVEGVGVAQVETQSSEVSGVVTGKQISQLVLNGRNFTQLVTLVPGVSNQTGQDEGTVGVYGNVSYAINGGRVEYNNWELDGGDNMDNGSNSTLNVYPNVDAIAEVKVLTSNYGAQYGRNGSGTVETVTKSGTKDFHGDLFEFFRNEDLNARGFFQTTRPSYKKNDYGYTLGGPLYIPGFFNRNKDKTFFFWSEEWRKERVPGQTFNVPVPSAQERTGNFSDLCPGAECPRMAGGQPFPGNQVPIDPNAQVIMNALIPSPNGGSGIDSVFNAAPVTPTNWREELIRVDHNFSDNFRLFGRFIHDSWSTITPTALWSNSTGSFPTVQTNFVGPGVAGVVHLTVNASPTLLNEFIWSYTTDHIFLNALGNVARPSSMTMTGLFNNGFGGQLPAINLSESGNAYGGGFGEDPGYFPWNNANPTYTFRDQVTKIWGNHNLYFGAYYVAAQKNEQNSPNLEGIANFSNTSPVTTGNAFADFLTGQMSSFQQWNSKVKYYNRYKIFEPYFQDDWHISKKLTLNLGLRVSMFGTYRDRYKYSYNWEPGAFDPATAAKIDVGGVVTGQSGALIPNSGNFFDGLVQCGVGGAPPGCMKGHLLNPAPRVGFAYDPFGNGKTSIRGGYGVFFEHTNGNEGNTESLEGSPPLVLTPTQYNINGYTAIGGGGLLFPLGVKAIPTRAIWPYMQQWHLDVQREVMRNTVVQVSYVGSKGTHLTWQRDLNQLLAVPRSANPFPAGQPITSAICGSNAINGTPVTGQALLNLGVACGNDPNPSRFYQGFSDITSLENQANSIYNALQVSARHSVGHLQFSLGYTWSHALDDSSDRYDGSFVDSYNVRASRASSNFDQRHLLNIGYVYDLPFFTHPGLTNKILGGWQVSGITAYQTGTPFSVTNGSYGGNAGVANGVGTGSYPDLAANPNGSITQVQVPGHPGPLLFNPAAFVAPTGLTFGTAGRNLLNNPARTNFDMGLFKHFAITENRAFEFRAEAFNIFNHTQWSGVHSGASCYAGSNNSAGDPSCVDTVSFLHPNGAHNPRIMQLGLKFLF